MEVPVTVEGPWSRGSTWFYLCSAAVLSLSCAPTEGYVGGPVSPPGPSLGLPHPHGHRISSA